MGGRDQPSATAQAAFRREIAPWALIGLTLGLVEGATAAVLVKTGFRASAAPAAVNLATALVSGAPAFANVVSFAWANIAHGRARVQLLVRLQALFALLVGLIGLAPRAGGGLVFAVASILAARMVWAGILTVRAAVWTANYPRPVIARMTGRIVIVSSLAVAGAAALAGMVLSARAFDPRWLYGGAAGCGLVAAWLYQRARVRREFPDALFLAFTTGELIGTTGDLDRNLRHFPRLLFLRRIRRLRGDTLCHVAFGKAPLHLGAVGDRYCWSAASSERMYSIARSRRASTSSATFFSSSC